MQAARLETAGDAKAMRADYLERTIARARDKVRDKGSDKLLKELSKRLGLGERRVIAVDLYGRGSNAVAYIHLADGDRIVFDTVGKVTTIGKMTAELALQVGAAPKLSATAVTRVLVLLHDLARHHDEHEAEDRAEELGMDFLRDVEETPVRMDDQADRWRAFAELDAATAYVDGHFNPQGAWVLRDTTTRTRYVRTGWFASYARQRAGPGEATVAMRAMLRIGWRKPNTEGRVKATAPERAATRSFKFFQVPDMWEER